MQVGEGSRVGLGRAVQRGSEKGSGEGGRASPGAAACWRAMPGAAGLSCRSEGRERSGGLCCEVKLGPAGAMLG